MTSKIEEWQDEASFEALMDDAKKAEQEAIVHLWKAYRAVQGSFASGDVCSKILEAIRSIPNWKEVSST